MIFIGLGANLESREYGPPMATLRAALGALNTSNCKVVCCSSWYRSAPVPASSQPWFVNGVAELESDMAPDNLLAHLHAIEDGLERVRTTPNAPRTIDLDLLVYDDQVLQTDSGLIVPHPRMYQRGGETADRDVRHADQMMAVVEQQGDEMFFGLVREPWPQDGSDDFRRVDQRPGGFEHRREAPGEFGGGLELSRISGAANLPPAAATARAKPYKISAGSVSGACSSQEAKARRKWTSASS